jgi:para-nitrobenzyl esterase
MRRKTDSSGSTLNRRQLLQSSAALTTLGTSLAMTSATVPLSSARAASNADTAVVDTASGKLRGKVIDDVSVFKGIPYGDSTAGAGRFMPPRPVKAWSGVRDAFDFGDSTMQPKGADVAWWEWIHDSRPRGEDCLVLNVFTPEATSARKRPVMFYLHGGGFNTGSASSPGVDGTQLAKHGDVVVVSINHRLNVFGFLYLADRASGQFAGNGNVGMLDAIAALRWVKENIAAFGGDADNVTIFGQSGGASKVAVLMAMPAAKGLFHKAIVQSASSLIKMATPEQAHAATDALLAALPEGAGIEALQQLPAADLLKARAKAIKATDSIDNFRPVVDGTSLPVHPFDPTAPQQSRDIPLLIGTCDTEQTFFLGPHPENFTVTREQASARIAHFVGIDDAATAQLYDSYASAHAGASPSDIMIYVLSDQMYRRNDTLAAERKAAQSGAPAYSYLFTWRSPVQDGKLKSPHTLCIPFVFGTYDAASLMIGTGPERAVLSRKVQAAWVNFARTGVPSAPDLPQWPPYSAERRATMIFDNQCSIVDDPRRSDRLALDKTPIYSPDHSARRAG